MRIAIFHDYFDEIGGAEITLLILARNLKAKIITTNIEEDKIRELGYGDIEFVSIGKVPNLKYVKSLSTIIKFYGHRKIKSADLVIFGGSLSIFASKKYFKKCIWYCFSPIRAVYDLKRESFSKYNLLAQIGLKIFKRIDKYLAKNIGKIIASSKNVSNRIERYYQIKNTDIAYCPIHTSKYFYKKNKNYWLSVARIDPYKRLEMQIKAFAKLKDEKLIIVGPVSETNKKYYKKIKKNCSKNVKFIGPIYKKEKLIELYALSKGLICTAQDEDFGMTPIEAMAAGKPVIASNEGGYKESVINGKTGILIDEIDEDKLANAIKKLSKEISKDPLKFKKVCQKQAKKFDTRVFIRKIKEAIKETIDEKKPASNIS